MIIYDKICRKYTKTEINQMVDSRTARKIYYNRETIPIGKICKMFSFDDIGYTLQDAIIDYEINKTYKEYEHVFNLLKKGYTINFITVRYELTASFEYMLKYGLNYNSDAKNGYKIIDILKIDIPLESFTIDKYETHIELFGKKEDLEKFKEKYNIHYNIIFEPFKKQWHLAFNGMLADWIRFNY